jgi:type I restriction enzyme, S subunit
MQIECFPDAPADWPRKVFADVAAVNPTYKLNKSTNYPFIEMAAVAEDFGGIISFDYRKADASGLARFKVGDILFGKITPCAENGKVALVKNLPSEFGLGSTEFIVLSPRNGNDRRFVYAMACANPVRGRAVSRMEGSTGRLRVTEDVFTKWLVVAAPPEPEQRAIADILDVVDAAIERTGTAIGKAQRLKSGLLQQVFAVGRFTETRLKDWTTDIRYGTSQAANEQGWGHATLRIPNIIGGVIDTADLTFVDTRPEDTERYALKAGDLLMVRTNGNPSYVGRAAVFTPPDERAWLFASYLIRVRFDASWLPQFISEFLNSDRGRKELFRRVSTSAGNYNVNTKNILSIAVPKPAKREQEKLVALVGAANAHISTMQTQLLALEKLKRGLMQALLTGKKRVPVSAMVDQQTRATLQPA